MYRAVLTFLAVFVFSAFGAAWAEMVLCEGTPKYTNEKFVKNWHECQGKLAGQLYDYEGYFRNGVFDGFGNLTTLGEIATTYEGEFKRGKKHGEGVVSYEQGWIQGVKLSVTETALYNLGKYMGATVSDLTFVPPNAETNFEIHKGFGATEDDIAALRNDNSLKPVKISYVGTPLDLQKFLFKRVGDGTGRIRISVGYSYAELDGTFASGKLNGLAFMRDANGQKTYGNFSQGNRNGLGKLTMGGGWYNRKGHFVFGNLKNNNVHGWAIGHHSASGTYYGKWKDAEWDGPGVFVAANGVIQQGIWKGAKLAEPKELKFSEWKKSLEFAVEANQFNYPEVYSLEEVGIYKTDEIKTWFENQQHRKFDAVKERIVKSYVQYGQAACDEYKKRYDDGGDFSFSAGAIVSGHLTDDGSLDYIIDENKGSCGSSNVIFRGGTGGWNWRVLINPETNYTEVKDAKTIFGKSVRFSNSTDTKSLEVTIHPSSCGFAGGMYCYKYLAMDDEAFVQILGPTHIRLLDQVSERHMSTSGLSGDTPSNNQDDTPPTIEITTSQADGRKGIIRGFAIDNVQIAEVLFDGAAVSLDSDGSFEWTGFVPATGKEITIEAIDTAALSSSKVIRLERGQIQQAGILRFDDLDPMGGKKVKRNDNALALIVGISKYDRTQAPAIFADKDAQYFHDYASLKMGIPETNITTMVNADAEQVDVLLAVKNWLSRAVKQNQSDVYVFFAGHGLASDDGEQMYLLPYDGAPELLDDTAIARERLFTDIASANPRSVTVFLDTCYSGTTRGTDMLIASRPIAIKALKQSVPDNFTVMTAAAGDQTAKPLEEAKHGMFSYFLMKGMEGEADANQDNRITAGELHSYVQTNVIQQSSGSQTPELQGDADRVLVQFQ